MSEDKIEKRRPYQRKNEGILTPYVYNRLSKAKAKEAYYKLAEVLMDNRDYITTLSYAIRSYRNKLRRRRRLALFNYKRRLQRMPYIRRSIRRQQKQEIIRLKKKLKEQFYAKIRIKVKARLERAKSYIPARINKRIAKVRARFKKQLVTQRKQIRKKTKQQILYRAAKAKVKAEENAFVGVIYKTKLPRISRSAGLHVILVKKIGRALSMTQDDIAYLLWVGTFETFNIGSLEILYQGIGPMNIRRRLNKFAKRGYIHVVGNFKGRNTYALTVLGRELFTRIVRYMKLYSSPVQERRMTKTLLRGSFKKRTLAKPQYLRYNIRNSKDSGQENNSGI